MRASETVDRSTKLRLLTPAVAGLFLSACLLATNVSAIPLAPGTTVPAVPEPNPTGGSPLAPNLVDPFSSSSFNGTVTSSVIVGDPSNPFGPSGLTFTYLIQMTGGPMDLSAFSVGSYGGYLVDVGFNPQNGGVPPTQVLRSGGFGNTITFQWLTGGGLAPNAMSALLVVETDATQFQIADGGVIDDSPTDLFQLYAPLAQTPTPLPDSTGTVMLLAAGLGALFVFRRFQFKPAVATV